jgi:two-component system sensor histidine kinase DegS
LQAHAFGVSGSANRDSLDRGMAMLAECIDESRNVIFDLRPSTLDDFGLVQALRQYLSRLERDLGWTVDFTLDGQVSPLLPTMETAVFRLVKEALTNAQKHADTKKVQVRLTAKANELAITVRDWGRGFDPRAASSRNGGQYGLVGMRERVSLLNGKFHLKSRPGVGTVIRITLPVE